jgi:hypothetical protein
VENLRDDVSVRSGRDDKSVSSSRKHQVLLDAPSKEVSFEEARDALISQ